MANYINEVKKDGVIYDIQDKRVDGLVTSSVIIHEITADTVLTEELFNTLKVGDMLKTDSHCYVIASKVKYSSTYFDVLTDTVLYQAGQIYRTFINWSSVSNDGKPSITDEAMSSGTKLYKHDISFNVTGSGTYSMCIINTSSEQFLTVSTNMMQNCIVAYMNGVRTYTLESMLSPWPGSTDITIDYIGTESISDYTVYCRKINMFSTTNVTDFIDTVTAL